MKFEDYSILKKDDMFRRKTTNVCELCYLDITKYSEMLIEKKMSEKPPIIGAVRSIVINNCKVNAWNNAMSFKNESLKKYNESNSKSIDNKKIVLSSSRRPMAKLNTTVLKNLESKYLVKTIVTNPLKSSHQNNLGQGKHIKFGKNLELNLRLNTADNKNLTIKDDLSQVSDLLPEITDHKNKDLAGIADKDEVILFTEDNLTYINKSTKEN